MKSLYKSTRLIAAAAAAALAIPASALTWDVQGKQCTVDTLYHAIVGPGITQTNLKLSGGLTERIFYTVVDLENPNADIRALAGGGNKRTGVRTLSKMCADASTEGAQYLYGANADFFSDNRALGSTVVDGLPVFISASYTSRPSFYVTDKKIVNIGCICPTGTIKNGKSSVSLEGINAPRTGLTYTVLYTDSYDDSVTPLNGSAISVELIEGSPAFIGSAKFKVLDRASQAERKLSGNIMAISSQANHDSFIKSLAAGSEIEIDFTTQLPVEGNIMNMVSGLPMILENDEVVKVTTTDPNYSHLYAAHPRTAVGYFKGNKKGVILVCDGRSAISSGCTAEQLGDIMRNIGCSYAVNLDGGGSSELYSKNFGIISQPCNGAERAVANGIWAVSTAPTDNTPASIAFEQFGTLNVPTLGSITPTIYAYNQYGDVIDTNFKGYTLSCDPSIGEISSDGLTFIGTGSGYGALTATYGDCSVKIPVQIGGDSALPKILIDKILIDNNTATALPVGADINGNIMYVSGLALNWTSADENIVIVDERGILHGVANGITTVTGSCEGYTGTVEVTVEAPEAYETSLALAKADWTLSKNGMNSATLNEEDGALKIAYNIKTPRTAYVTLRNRDGIKLFSRPDSIRVIFTAKADGLNKVSVGLADNAGTSYVYEKEYESNQEAEVLTVPLAATIGIDGLDTATNPTAASAYPVSLNMLRFDPKGAAKSAGTVRITAIEMIYSHFGQSGIKDVAAADGALSVYPNPASGSATLTGVEEGTLYEIYNLAGFKVAAGIAPAIDCSALAPGLYLIKAAGSTARLIIR